MIKTHFSLLFILLSSLIYSQDLCLLEIESSNSSINKQMEFKVVTLFNGIKKLDNYITNNSGEFTFLIDSIYFNSDSLYFKFDNKDSIESETKIYINQLNLIGKTIVDSYILSILEFKYYTFKEFDNYCIGNNLMPRRIKTKAIEMH